VVAEFARVDEAGSGERVHSVAASSDRLSDSLHRGLAASGLSSALCWLLLDPSPLGMQEADEPALAGLLMRHAVCRVKPSRAGVPREMAPALLPLDAAAPADSALIRLSLELALQELPLARLAQGGGRVIAAWLECEGEPQEAQAALQRHFAQNMFARRADGRLEWLRWYDPAVLWVLWARLSAAQQCLLLGPVSRYWLLTPSAELLCLTAQPASAQDAVEPAAATMVQVEFTVTQWSVIDAIGALNVALTQTQASGLDATALERARDAGMSALARAQQAGFTDRQDLVAYACKAITCHPDFDQHALIAQHLRAAQPGDFFSAAVDDITDEQWRQIGQELNEGRNPAAISKQKHSP
jgi:Domain of unknown function (DUF4123)